VCHVVGLRVVLVQMCVIMWALESCFRDVCHIVGFRAVLVQMLAILSVS